MTAMMCFFLVMWLINAANEQTKAAVASYFNPVKLIDRNSSKKGLEDLGEGPNSAGQTSESTQTPDAKASEEGHGKRRNRRARMPPTADKTETHTDKHLFANPYAVLAEIAEDTGMLQNISTRGDGGAQTSGPVDRRITAAKPTAILSRRISGRSRWRAPDETARRRKPVGHTASRPTTTSRVPPSARGARRRRAAGAARRRAEAQARRKSSQARAGSETVEGEPSASHRSKAADAIREKLAAIASAPDNKLAEGLTVIAGENGVTISVTDQFDFGMFEVGSAVPRRDLVLAMEKIGKILAGQKGTLTIDGHTDARPVPQRDLRQLAALHRARPLGLLHAGARRPRREPHHHVAGHAARKLKDKADPLAASNRRIEILLDVGG